MPTSRTRRNFRLRSTAAAIALGFALVSCDSGGSDDGASEAPADDAATDGANESETDAEDNAEDAADAEDNPDDSATDTGGDSQAGDGQGWDGNSEPAFLEPGELPNAFDDAWMNKQTSQGVPDRDELFCLDGLAPADSSWFRHFSKDLLGDAYQVNISTPDAQAAADLVAELNAAAANCADERDNERGTTDFLDHGDVNAGDEAHAYSLVWTPNDPGGIYGAAVGIGRAGTTVTYLYIVDGADIGDFPSGTFDEPLSTALSRAGG